ncbi:hypothetical protein FAIPA1_20304 [Frankia sp. AiPs1]
MRARVVAASVALEPPKRSRDFVTVAKSRLR